MNPPAPAPFTSDETQAPAPSPLSLGIIARARKWLSIVGAVVISAGVVLLIGYGLGRRSVLPHPGEEARLDSVVKVLAARADSLRQVADWERAMRALLEQKQAAGPQIEIREPGVIVIRPVDSSYEPRVVPVPVEVTAALSLERQINASLRVELDAEHRRADAERARADSATRAVHLARAVRTDWVTGGVTGGYDPLLGAWAVQADAGLRLTDDWSLRASIDQHIRKGEKPRGLVGLRRAF